MVQECILVLVRVQLFDFETGEDRQRELGLLPLDKSEAERGSHELRPRDEASELFSVGEIFND